MLDFTYYSYPDLVLLFILVLAWSILVVTINKRYKKVKKEIKNSGDSRYMELVDLLPQTVIEFDNKGQFEFINKHGQDLLGFSNFEIKKETIHNIIHPSDRHKFYQEYLYLLEGGQNRGQEYRVITKYKKVLYMVFYLKKVHLLEKDEPGLRGIMIDISKRIKLERKVLNSVMETEDKERRRFSEDLHDGLGPLLSTVKLYINQMTTDKCDNAEGVEMLAFANDLLDEAIVTTRNIANNILPGSIVDNGLIAAIQAFIIHIKNAGNINIEFNDNITQRFENNIEINIYRIIIELINNSLKYAEADKIEVDLSLNNNILSLQYKDDGIGFNIDNVKKGLGHKNIKNRSISINGEYEYTSEINRGMIFNLKVEIN